jgi:hypothetical protein
MSGPIQYINVLTPSADSDSSTLCACACVQELSAEHWAVLCSAHGGAGAPFPRGLATLHLTHQLTLSTGDSSRTWQSFKGTTNSPLCMETEGGLERPHSNPESRRRRRKWNPMPGGLSGPTLSLGDIITGIWSSRLGVGHKADGLVL